MSNPSITADKTPWYQWDTGLTVTVSGGEMNECHFANRKQGTAYVQAVINGVARVPDELLQVAAPIKAYGYVSDGAGGQTYIEQTFEVIARNIPSDYAYTKTAQKTIRDAEAARDQAVQAAKDAKASELAADDSAVEASNSAQSAGESAYAAATSASNAAKSAGDAAKSASDAKAAADKAVEDASALLKTYTDNAKTSADNAATSASSAADAASAASGSASAAEQSATDASNAKVAAQTAKAEAEAANNEAATSASNAATSAEAAAQSASDAAASVGAINVIAPKNVDIVPTFVGGDSLAIGRGAKVSDKGNFSVVIGSYAHAHTIGTVAIGPGAVDTIDTKGQNVIIGDNAQVNGAVGGSVVLGSYSIAVKDAELSIGHGATDTGIAETTREITHVSTPTAPTSASTKKYTDDNDAKTLSEANKYTDANTSNALVGNVSGKLLHVDDAWPGKPLGLTIDGAYKQDGTPSPENPVPIFVIENPVLQVTGRNLLDTDMGLNKCFIKNADGTYTITKISDSERFSEYFPLRIPRGMNVYLSITHMSAGVTGSVSIIFDYADGTQETSPLLSRDITAYFVKKNVRFMRFYVEGKVAIGESFTFLPQINYGTEATAYTPYVGTSLPITLPAEHPYLAALPDGTHDEIAIDKDGNASLVARVQKVDMSNLQAPGSEEALGNGLNRYQYAAVVNPPAMVDTAVVAPAFKSVINYAFPEQGLYVSKRTVIVGASSDPTDALRAGGYIYTTLATPITYSLGKLDIPALPETISNVWTDAELTTNMSMTYKRDINIAFGNLVQAVVASAAGE